MSRRKKKEKKIVKIPKMITCKSASIKKCKWQYIRNELKIKKEVEKKKKKPKNWCDYYVNTLNEDWIQ